MATEVTGPQAAAILGVSRTTVRTLALEGVLPYRCTPGGHRRFLEFDVLALRAQRSSGESPGAANRAAVWAAAAQNLLRGAVADLGSSSTLAGPFAAADDLLQERMRAVGQSG